MTPIDTEWADAIWNVAPFDSFSDDDRAALLACGERRTVSAMSIIYDIDEDSTGAFIVLQGGAQLTNPALSASVSGATGATSALLGAGTIVSAGSLLDAYTHRHRFTAATDTELFHLPRERFDACFRAGNTFAYRLIDFIVTRGAAEVRSLNEGIHALLDAQ